MKRRAQKLNSSRRGELRERLGAAPLVLPFSRQRYVRREARRGIERRKDGERVPHGVEHNRSWSDGAGSDAGWSEDASEIGVLDEARAHVRGGTGGELGGACGFVCWAEIAVERGEDGVDCICGDVGGRVDHED